MLKFYVAISCLILISLFANAEEPTYRKVQQGETFYRIAIQTFPNDIGSQPNSVEKLKALNPDIQDVTKIKLGQKIITSGNITATVVDSHNSSESQQEPTEQIDNNKMDLINEPAVTKVLTEEEVERQISQER